MIFCIIFADSLKYTIKQQDIIFVTEIVKQTFLVNFDFGAFSQSPPINFIDPNKSSNQVQMKLLIFETRQTPMSSSHSSHSHHYIGPPEDPMEPDPPSPILEELPTFAWGQRWLTGAEYGLMLERREEYCVRLGFERCSANEHPLQIYENPRSSSGIIRWNDLFHGGRRTFHFSIPTHQSKKDLSLEKDELHYESTKTSPDRYILSSFIFYYKLNSNNAGAIPFGGKGGYLLCHVRRVAEEKQDNEPKEQELPLLSRCFPEGQPNFYELFAFLHNYRSTACDFFPNL